MPFPKLHSQLTQFCGKTDETHQLDKIIPKTIRYSKEATIKWHTIKRGFTMVSWFLRKKKKKKVEVPCDTWHMTYFPTFSQSFSSLAQVWEWRFAKDTLSQDFLIILTIDNNLIVNQPWKLFVPIFSCIVTNDKNRKTFTIFSVSGSSKISSMLFLEALFGQFIGSFVVVLLCINPTKVGGRLILQFFSTFGIHLVPKCFRCSLYIKNKNICKKKK